MISGGKSFVYSPPAFSNDAKKLLVCAGNAVSVFSTSTGLQITELEGHKGPVTSVTVVPVSASTNKVLGYCWTASVDGTIRYWDFSTPELMKTIDICLPIFSMVIPGLYQSSGSNEDKRELFALVAVEAVKGQEKQSNHLLGNIRKCNLTKSRLVPGVLAESRKPEFITISPDGNYWGFREKRKLRIWNVPAKDSALVVYKKMRLHHTANFTTLAFHPTERVIAAGDVKGRILIWRNFGKKTFSIEKQIEGGMEIDDERPGVRGDDDADSCTTWHWHSHEVRVLFFSSDGAYLYSGGKEGVLVVWQLDTGKKKFLPRIGSPLMYYTRSPDPSLSAISCLDNRIHLLKLPSMEILKSIAGIKLPCSAPETYTGSSNGFAFDHSTGSVALSTENYCIQFYSLFDDREVSEVQVCERNHQPGDDVTVIVNLVALSPDGSMMCTVETKLSEEGIGGLISVKFWARNSHNKGFSLSTVIYEPHRDAVVSAITFHPTRHIAVSASYGGDFKIWARNHAFRQKDKMLESTGWTCHAVGSYKKRPMTAAAFSADGSVLAVAAETVITLWDPDKNILVAVIGESLESIVTLSFVGQTNYLVSASRGSNSQVSVWSMSELSLCWTYKLQVEAVACSPENSDFAVLAHLPKSFECKDSDETLLWGTDGAIMVFAAADPVPKSTWFVKKTKGGGLAFLGKNEISLKEAYNTKTDEEVPETMLAYVNGNHEYVIFDPFGDQTPHDEHSIFHKKGGGLGEKEIGGGKSGYESIYGELPEFSLKKNQNLSVEKKNENLSAEVLSEKPWETLFSGSSHTLPPLTRLLAVYLESLLAQKTSAVDNQD